MLVAKQITFNLWLIRNFKTPTILTDGKLLCEQDWFFGSSVTFFGSQWPHYLTPVKSDKFGQTELLFTACNQHGDGGVRFLGGSSLLATAVVIREVQIGDFSHSRHSHLPHLGAQLVWVLRNFFEIRSLSETMKKDLSTAFYCPLLWGWQHE